MSQTRNLKAEYEARLLSTESNLKRHVNDTIGVINSVQAGDMAEEDGLMKLDELDQSWAKTIVNDLAPLEHLLKGE